MKKLIAPLFAVAALASALTFAVTAQERPAAKATTPAPAAAAPHDAHAAAFEACAKACDDCKRMCDLCAAHCVKMVAEGKKEHLKTVETCADCATFCGAASCIVARQGAFSDLICTSCADACNRCGKACEQLGKDAMMKKCAEECFKCEKACRDMLTHTRRADAR